MKTRSLLGIIFCVFVSLLLGLAIGVGQFYLQKITQNLLNPVLVSALLLGPLVFLYNKTVGSDYNNMEYFSRISLGFIAIVGYGVNIIAYQYSFFADQSIDTNLIIILEESYKLLTQHPWIHAFSLIIPIFFTFGKTQVAKTILEVQHSKDTDISVSKLGAVKSLLIVVSILFPVGLMWLASEIIDSQISFRRFLLYSGALHFSFVLIAYLVANHFESFEKFILQSTAERYRSAFTKFIFINLICVLWSCSIFFALIIANVKMDRSVAQLIKTRLGPKIFVTFQNRNEYCYKVRHWEDSESVLSERFCESEYGPLKDEEVVELWVRDGGLGVPWVERKELARLKNIAAYINSLESESEIRFNAIKYLYNNHKQDMILNKKFAEWGKICQTKPGYECRLASYIYSLRGDEKQAVNLLDQGCDASDLTACYGLYLNPASLDEQKLKYQKLLESKCDAADYNTCRSLGSLLWNLSYRDNFSKIRKIYERLCMELSEKEDCKYLEYIKTHPVKSGVKN